MVQIQSAHFNGFSASGQLEAAELIRSMITKPQRQQPDQTHLKLLQMSGDVHPNPGSATKYPCVVCTRNVTSRGVSYKCTRCSGWVHAKCSEILNAAQYWKKVIGPATPARPHRPSNHHHQLYPLLRLPNRSTTTARSTSYSSTLTESGTS